VHLDSQQQATNHIAIGNSITSLRFLTSIDWKDFVEAMSRVESVLRGTLPGLSEDGLYYPGLLPSCDRENGKAKPYNRGKHCRAGDSPCAKLGKRDKNGPHRRLLDRSTAAGVGERGRDALDDRRYAAPHREKAPLLFLSGAPACSFTAGFTALALREIHGAGMTTLWVAGLLILLGSSQAALALVNWAATMVVRPRVLPKMDFMAGIPPESCTLITVPSMLAGKRAIAALLNKMEVCYLSNRADNLYFSLLTDFEDAVAQTMPGDAALLDLARTGIKRLNDTYARNGCRPFLFFHRSREWNKQEQRWMGRERKRGKLETLNGFLRSLQPTGFLIEGDPAIAPNVKYVITLDTDTELPRDCARHLIEAMAHPLNAPVYDSVKGSVVDGYAILQPRVVSSLPAIGASWYSRLFGSDSGIDPIPARYRTSIRTCSGKVHSSARGSMMSICSPRSWPTGCRKTDFEPRSSGRHVLQVGAYQ